MKRLTTVGRVVVAGGIVMQRKETVGSVVVAGGVAKERNITIGRVVVARLCCYRAQLHRWPCFARRWCC